MSLKPKKNMYEHVQLKYMHLLKYMNLYLKVHSTLY